MLERNILIVDDNARISSLYLPLYKDEIVSITRKEEKWKDYKFNFFHLTTMQDALNYMQDRNHYVDVLVVDYNFNGEKTFPNGADFIKHIREKVNRHCQIVFYTMQSVGSIETNELVDLINSDVYKMVDKVDNFEDVARVFFEAATLRNPIVEALESFCVRYRNMLQTYTYSIGEENISFDDMISHIRMDDNIGRHFTEKLLQKAILLDITI